MISRINSIGINPAYLNVTTRPVQPQVAFKGLEQDTFTPSVKPASTTVQTQLSSNEQAALAFGKDLNALVDLKMLLLAKFKNLSKNI